jgi:hypothetical protein
MSTFRAFLVALAVLIVSSAPAKADIIISVTPSLGPNYNGSPNAGTYYANALSGIPTTSATGTAGTPGYYSPLSGPTPISSIVVTNFNSWMGNANPTGAFSAETGTRLYYGLSITSSAGTDTGLTIAQVLAGLSFAGTTSPDTTALDFSFSSPPGFTGLDPAKYTYTTDGSGFVTSFYYTGANNAFAVFAGDDPNDPTNNQAAINYDLAGIPSFSATGTYSLNGVSGSGTVAITSTPEPASLTLMGIGLGALVWRQRKRLLKKA